MTTPDMVADFPLVTRFAPSPTGLLHLGHALSAMLGWRLARAGGGRWLVRMEDIDTARCRPEHEAAILEDLAWLGLAPDGPVWRQSERAEAYGAALDKLRALGLIYACQCTRGDIAAAAAAPHGPEGPLYPGTCRSLGLVEGAWRIDAARAAAIAGPLFRHDRTGSTRGVDPLALGDFVVARRGLGTSYHLAVVVDDAAQGVSLVVRGEDLDEATHAQRLLQAVLGLPAPRYLHHPLLCGADGKRLAKRDASASLAALRAAGMTAEACRAQLDESLVAYGFRFS